MAQSSGLPVTALPLRTVDPRLILDGSVTTPLGFQADALAAGIKPSGRPDLGVVVSDAPCAAAGLFTQSTVPGAPVVVSKEHIRDGRAQAIIVNSGISNVAMGEQGMRDAREMARLAGVALGLRPGDVLVASTGVIGHALPMDLISEGIARLRPDRDGGLRLAEAIMTTDTARKSTAIG